ncbi:FtsX-like permease family protein [Alicyclobacillus herbarius]|uniref:FtsX-like permease family protein n=1 Tax=Alicyclobacillus herbarius TaxID=122960 RepID=UPI00040CD617|nr:FtsX-like permease family protein [Alicyclobacillus herbarius]
MSWPRLLLKNTLHAGGRHAGYWISFGLAVMIYFLYSCFVNNPAVLHGKAPRILFAMVEMSQATLVLFSALFVFFVHAAQGTNRKHEIRLLFTLGMTPRQIWLLTFGETLLLCLLALVTGIVAGLLFNRLFLLFAATVLHISAISVSIPQFTVWRTVTWFGLAAIADSILIALRVERQTHLHTKPTTTIHPAALSPRSILRGVLAPAFIVGAYVLALITRDTTFLTTTIPVIFMVCVGTHLLYRWSLPHAIHLYRTTSRNMMTRLMMAMMNRRVVADARTLTMVTLTFTTMFTGLGMVFFAHQIAEINTLRIAPISIQLLSNNASSPVIKEIHSALNAEQLKIVQEVNVPILSGKIQDTASGSRAILTVMAISQSAFEQVRNAESQSHPELSRYLPDCVAAHAIWR